MPGAAGGPTGRPATPARGPPDAPRPAPGAAAADDADASIRVGIGIRIDTARRLSRDVALPAFQRFFLTPMSTTLENSMYALAQLFLLPTLIAIALLFLYAFWVLGEFLVLGLRRRQGAGRPLVAANRAAGTPGLSDDELDLRAHKLMEGPRIASRVTPLLGLVATMIPMGPALKGLADGNLAQVSSNLTVAFSAVILALIAAAITFWVASVRRRWLAEEILEITRSRPAGRAA